MNWDRPEFLVENGQTGDCWRCCIAAVLQVPAETVPHFLEEALKNGGGNMDCDTQVWLNERGYSLLSTGFSGSGRGGIHFPRRWSDDMSHERAIMPIISCGPTVRSKKMGEHHAVVTVNDKVVYDPHPSNAGILAVTDEYMVVPHLEKG